MLIISLVKSFRLLLNFRLDRWCCVLHVLPILPAGLRDARDRRLCKGIKLDHPPSPLAFHMGVLALDLHRIWIHILSCWLSLTIFVAESPNKIMTVALCWQSWFFTSFWCNFWPPQKSHLGKVLKNFFWGKLSQMWGGGVADSQTRSKTLPRSPRKSPF